MNLKEARCIARQGHWLADKPKHLVELFIEPSRLRFLEAGELLYRAGDSAGGLYGVADGAMRIELNSPSNAMQLMNCNQRGVWFGQKPGVFKAAERTITYRAACPTALLEIPIDDVRAFTQSSMEAALMMGSLSEWFLDRAEQVIVGLMITSAKKRAAAAILRVANYPVGLPLAEGWPVQLNQSDLSQIANCSRDTMNQATQEFEKRGWIAKGYQRILVIDADALHEFANAA